MSNILEVQNEPQQHHLDVLSNNFGHEEFKPDQWKIINSILNKKQDNLCVMATGYGKSLCYQFPPVFTGGTSIVISPLISLVEDQVNYLTDLNIPACILGADYPEEKVIEEDILKGEYRLVYLMPEYVKDNFKFLESLLCERLQDIVVLAVDEAHCISQRGYNFRPDFKRVSWFREKFPDIPILAVTASATEPVRKDIIESLKLRHPQIIYGNLDRPNLCFAVLEQRGERMNEILTVFLNEEVSFNIESGSVVIYCRTIDSVNSWVKILRRKRWTCEGYHGEMDIEKRKSVHKKFSRDKIKILVTTNAFGIGIDKQNVRCVIHFGAHSDMESYYREVGIAGRDGQPSICVLYYSYYDTDRSSSMHEYIHIKKTCRRDFLIENTQPTLENDNGYLCCDNCNMIFYPYSH